MSQATAGTLDITFRAGETLTDKQYYFVKLNSDGDVVISDGYSSISIGILQNAPADEKAARVRLLGTSKLVMAEECPAEGPLGGFNKGALITSNGDGKGVVANVNQYVGAIALEAAASADEIIEVLITHIYTAGSV